MQRLGEREERPFAGGGRNSNSAGAGCESMRLRNSEDQCLFETEHHAGKRSLLNTSFPLKDGRGKGVRDLLATETKNGRERVWAEDASGLEETPGH